MGRKIDPTQRDAVDRRNRALLQEDLLRKRLLFASRPYEAHVQFSNFCNMSCIMCWDGENPPLQKMSPQMIARVAQELGPHLTVIIPHGGSEPLVVTWDETRDMAERYSIELGLTTNVQFLDEDKFAELEDIVELVVLSVDSHVPEIFAKIRPKSRPERVFRNLETVSRLARERGVECLIQIVFMTENAALLPETVAYVADAGFSNVKVIQLMNFNGRSGYSDPLLHFSADYVERTKRQCIDVSKEKRICFKWFETETYDYREHSVPPKPHRVANDELDYWAKYALPGYCKYAYSRVRLHSDGEVAPCGWATEGDLTLGNIGEQTLEQVWNGVNARDLRRAHLTHDYPTLCKTCRYTDPAPPQLVMPFLREAEALVGAGLAETEPAISVLDPPHMARIEDAPSIRVETPARRVSGWFVALSLGSGVNGPAGAAEVHVHALVAEQRDDGTTRLEVPDEAWQALRTNMGYWWTPFAVLADDSRRALRAVELRCVVRHEPIERLAGSTLTYPDEDARPFADLGGAMSAGWTERESLQERPLVRPKRSGLWAGERAPARRPRRRRAEAGSPA
jgi:radical SAM protein with 4Fe4S-binding SPASM domain